MDVVAVVGLGYVGLPLAVEFGKKQRTIGFDLSVTKIESYQRHIDPTGELSTEKPAVGHPSYSQLRPIRVISCRLYCNRSSNARR